MPTILSTPPNSSRSAKPQTLPVPVVVLALACSPEFSVAFSRQNKWHVLEDKNIPDPGRPPYYSADMFNSIKVAISKGMPVKTMSTSQWYRFFVESNVTMEEDVESQMRRYRQSRVEKLRPELDWERSWGLARQRGLDSDQLTFLWRMMHDLLPTQTRQHRLSPLDSQSRLCQV